MKRLILAAVLAVLAVPALAQSPYPPGPPPPVPALPDSARQTTYTISATTCACAVGFQLYGDGTDFQNWIEVWLNGVQVQFNDPTFGWSLSSPTGNFATIPRPITDAVLTFNNAQTGTVVIVGAQRPRRLTEYTEGQGVPARAQNQSINALTAIERELWDKTNDLTGRGLFFAPGNHAGPMPNPSACASSFLGFDGTGLNPLCQQITSVGSVIAPGGSTNGDIVSFNGTTGKNFQDSGIASSNLALLNGTNTFINPINFGSASYKTGQATFNSNTVLGLYEGGLLISPNQAVAPILDSGFNFPNYYWNGFNNPAEFARMDMDWYHQADLDELFSNNQQQQPGAIGFGGTWAAGDIAKIQFVYSEGGSIGVTVQCTVAGSGSSWTCGTGSGTTAPAAISTFFATHFQTNPMTPPIYFNGNGPATANTPSSGFTGFQYLTYWHLDCCSFNNQSTTALGTVSTTGPVNTLDGPVGYFIYRNVPPDAVFSGSISGSVLTVSSMISGSLRDGACLVVPNGSTCQVTILNEPTQVPPGTFGGTGTYNLSGSPGNSGTIQMSAYRNPQANDNVGVLQYLGPTIAVPAGGIPYAEIVTTITNASTPSGKLEVQTICPGSSGNGCVRLGVGQGVGVGNAGGTWTDNGAGTFSVPGTGSYYVGSTQGATCGPGAPGASFQVVGGIVTHC